MKRLITLSLVLICSHFAIGQPTIIIQGPAEFEEGIDPWNGTLCTYQGDPSSGIVPFSIKKNDAVAITLASSNPLVVPIDDQHLSLDLLFTAANTIRSGTVGIYPLREGQTTITITAYDEDWNASNYYLEVTVKTCRDIQLVRRRDIIPLDPTRKNIFSANITARTRDVVIIPAGSDIEFYGGTSVELNAGFEVEIGAEFLADIAPCLF